MYQRSTGMVPGRKCSECSNFVEDGKQKRCIEHSLTEPWKPDWMACKYFTTGKKCRQMKLELLIDEN